MSLHDPVCPRNYDDGAPCKCFFSPEDTAAERDDRLRAEGAAARTRDLEKVFRDHGRQWDEMARRLEGTAGSFTKAQAEAKAKHYHDAADYVMNRYPDAFPPATPPTRETEPAPSTFVCSECGVEFDRYLQVREHMRIEHKEPATPPTTKEPEL